MARNGSPLGRALIAAWGGGRRSSYRAKGWHAQLRALTQSPRGSAAADRAGLDITERTLKRWLSDEDYPVRSGDRARIAQAYEILAGAAWDRYNERRDYRVHGDIDSGDRIETRTLFIEGRNGNWARIERAYERGELTEEDAEDWFIEDVICDDIGPTSPRKNQPGNHTGTGWSFPGSSYTV